MSARERARKLIALATGANTPGEEARTAAMAACKIILEHKLLDVAPTPEARVSFADVVREWAQTTNATSARGRTRPPTEARPIDPNGKQWRFTEPVIIRGETPTIYEVEWFQADVGDSPTWREVIPKSEVTFIQIEHSEDGSRIAYLAIKLRYAFILQAPGRSRGKVEPCPPT